MTAVERRRSILWTRRIVALAVMCILFVFVGAFTSPARARAPSATGWWWVGSSPLAFAVTPAPEVPEGGLYVAGSFDQPTGISALRFEVPKDAVVETLTLEVADAVGEPAVIACRAASRWQSAEGGAWSDRPAADCAAGEVTATTANAGSRLQFAVEPLRQASVIDIVLMPAAASPPDDASTFSVSFNKPDGDALALVPAAKMAEPTGPTLAELPTEQPPGVPARTSFPAPQLAPPLPSPAPSNVIAAPSAPVSTEPLSVGFSYSMVFMVPLVLLISGGYLARTLTRVMEPPTDMAPSRSSGFHASREPGG